MYPDNKYVVSFDLMYAAIQLKKLDDALAVGEEYLEAFPGNDKMLTRMGIALMEADCFKDAEVKLQEAEDVSKYDIETESAYAALLEIQNRNREALERWARAIEANPMALPLRFYAGMTLLRCATTRDEFLEGFHNYDARLAFANTCPKNGKRIWRGPNESHPTPEQLEAAKMETQGKRLAVYAEQGLGDNIMAFRFLLSPSLHKAFGFAEVHFVFDDSKSSPNQFDVYQEMADQSGLPNLKIHRASEFSEEYDFHTLILNLMRVAYLYGDPTAIEPKFWNGPYIPKPNQSDAIDGVVVKVGICYQGGRMHVNDRRRSIAPAYIADFIRNLKENCDVIFEFHILQGEPPTQELLDLGVIHTPMPNLMDFKNGIGKMDLVVTVDTSTAHIAGAMGIRTILLAAKGADWRWKEDGEYSYWYGDTFLIKRQFIAGQWDVTLADLAFDFKNAEFVE
ncbi:MAG: hypothetical protein HC888_03275 [Candidatus Competibacteraceae bacterium]|nr:hypothetical protein [Candidatus Competibacteraceae bacterium]